MKLFGSNPEKILEWLKQPIIDNEIELEVIFGSTPWKNPINKGIFMKVLDVCKNTYMNKSETTDLDIRTQYKGYPSNVRATIHGLNSIKKYCKNESFEGISDIEFMHKKAITGFNQLKDENYNIRLNVKHEKVLEDSHYFVRSFKEDYENKNKHYRYKKRFSFITDDRLFRIDLTIIKATNYRNRKYDFQKTFKKANILQNKETYEIEIEYIGWTENVGVPAIDNLFSKSIEERELLEPNIHGIGNIYDPLNIINNFQMDVDYDKVIDYDINEKQYTYEPNGKTTILMGYNESSVRYTEEDYRELIGKYTLIRKKYFEENTIDINIYNTIIEYFKKGIHIPTISEVYEEIESNNLSNSEDIDSKGVGGKYIDTKVKVVLSPSIGNTSELIVPLKYIYGGYFNIKESAIESMGTRIKTEETLLHLNEGQEGGGKDKNPNEKSIKWGPKGGNTIDKISKEIYNILEKHVIYLSKVVYDTEKILSYKLKEDIIKQYKRLTKQRGNYFNFIGPQPVTLKKEDLNSSNPNSIIMDYAVTEKADGERYELFVHNNHGYLINAKENIIDTDWNFLYTDGDWLFDGEYITKDKYNESIKKYMIFDVYWSSIKGDGIPKDTHTLPFLTRDPLDRRSRKYVLDRFNEIISDPDVVRKDGDNPIEIGIKEYHYGYQTQEYGEELDNSKVNISKYIEIFKSSKNILKKDREDFFPYRIDGLIYLPTRLSVRGNRENVNSQKISGTWNYNYKWKPPEENTIDFLVKFQEDIHNGIISDVVKPYVDSSNGSKVLKEYKSVNLYVGYKEEDDHTIDYCMKILNKSKRSTDTIQKFNNHLDEENRFNTTNLVLVNGRAQCLNIEKDEIKDGYLVEMRFNNEAKDGMYWEPLRVRSDKKKPQYQTSANNIWKTILDPVTEEMITGKDFIKGNHSMKDEGIYYIDREGDLLPHTYTLRKFHNYIKSRLISGICTTKKGKIRVMDLSCGRGGDVHKYLETRNVSLLFGIDISSNYHEACRRFYSANNKECKAIFLRGDTSKNIRDNSYCQIENGDEKDKNHCEVMTNILYGNNKPITKEYKEIHDHYFGLATPGFDVLSSQFSLHYYFKSEETFNGFIQNLNENTKKGGYFIGTCYDGEKIFNYFKNAEMQYKRNNPEDSSSTPSESNTSSESSESNEFDLNVSDETSYRRFEMMDNKGNLVFRIEKGYDLNNFEDNIFGNVIDVYMDSIGQTIPEYLVNFDFFIKVMNENGFKPVIPSSVHKNYSSIFRKDNFNDKNIGEFSQLVEKIPELERVDPDFNKKFSGAKDVYSSGKIDTLTSFNNYFIFQKIN